MVLEVIFVRLVLKLLGCALAVAYAFSQVHVDVLAQLESETCDPSLSPDGKTLAFDWCKPDYTCAIYTRPLAGGDPQLLLGEDDRNGTPYSLKWSPDGRSIAFTRFYSHYDTHLLVAPLAGKPARDLGQVCSGEAGWSPDSKSLVADVYLSQTDVENCRVVLIDALGGRQVRQYAAHGSGPAFSPDGKLLAYADGRTLKLLRLNSGYSPLGAAKAIAVEPRGIDAIRWSPDSKWLLYRVWGDSPYVRKLAVADGARPHFVAGLSSDLEISAILPGGRAVATESVREEGLWKVDLEAHSPQAERADDGLLGEVVSQDGRRVAYVSERGSAPQIWIADADGSDPHLLVKSVPDLTSPREYAHPRNLTWSPDGHWVAFDALVSHGNADIHSWLYVVPAAGGPLRRLGGRDVAHRRAKLVCRQQVRFRVSGKWSHWTGLPRMK